MHLLNLILALVLLLGLASCSEKTKPSSDEQKGVSMTSESSPSTDDKKIDVSSSDAVASVPLSELPPLTEQDKSESIKEVPNQFPLKDKFNKDLPTIGKEKQKLCSQAVTKEELENCKKDKK